MNRAIKIHGVICNLAGAAIARSVLYRALTLTHGAVEVWPSLVERSDGWSYFWLVSYKHEIVRELAFARYHCDNDVLQEQIEGPFKTELWKNVEHVSDARSNLPIGLNHS